MTDHKGYHLCDPETCPGDYSVSDFSEGVIMVHLNHPCREIDVWVLDREQDYFAAIKQGYLPLDVIRQIVLGV